MRTPVDLAARASTRYQRGFTTWVVDPEAAQAAEVVLALAPPTQGAALTRTEAVTGWIASWRAWGEQGLGTVERAQRQWASLGAQWVPVRVRVTGAGAIAQVAGRGEHWALVRERGAFLLGELGGMAEGAAGEGLACAVSAVIGEVAHYPADDVERLTQAVRWLATHPASGRYLRQLPIGGLDTKWLERHRRAVMRLLAAVRGVPRQELDLGLRRAEAVVRLRVLDEALAVGGIDDLSVPVGQAGRLWPGRQLDVVVVENLATFLALEPREGTVAVWGAGGAVVGALPQVAWVRGARRIVYWGDLDADGLAILGALAQRLGEYAAPDAPEAGAAGASGAAGGACMADEASAPTAPEGQAVLVPVLMDAPTFHRYRALAVADPGAERHQGRPAPAGVGEAERQAWEAVTREGARLEQERLPWPEVQQALEKALRDTCPRV